MARSNVNRWQKLILFQFVELMCPQKYKLTKKPVIDHTYVICAANNKPVMCNL